MVNVRPEVLFRFYSFLLLFVKLFWNETVLCGDCEEAHCEVQNLAQDASWIYLVLLFDLSAVLYWCHIYNLADRIVANMLLKIETNLLDHFILIPSFDCQLGQHNIPIDFRQNKLLLEDFDLPYQSSQVVELHLVLLRHNNLLVLTDIAKERFQNIYCFLAGF